VVSVEGSTSSRPFDKLRGRSIPDKLRLRGRSILDKLRGRSIPDKRRLRGRSILDKLRGRSIPDKLRGRSILDKLRGRSIPDKLRGRSIPDKLRGRSMADRLTERPCRQARGTFLPADPSQAVTSNVAVSSAVELPPTQTSNVEGSSTQSRSTAFQ
jgi:hypothetical protein